MVKTLTCVTIDATLKELAKARQINISRAVDNALRLQLAMKQKYNAEEDMISDLKAEVLKLSESHIKLREDLENKIKEKDNELLIKKETINKLKNKLKRYEEKDPEHGYITI